MTFPQIGDWFVLHQLCKNCNPYFFREFIRELAIELRHRPKRSKSRSMSVGLEISSESLLDIFIYISGNGGGTLKRKGTLPRTGSKESKDLSSLLEAEDEERGKV